MTKYIKIFKELSYKDVAIAGGKGASLGEMVRNKIPVPDGFVTLACQLDSRPENSTFLLKFAMILAPLLPEVLKKVKYR